MIYVKMEYQKIINLQDTKSDTICLNLINTKQ